MTIAALRSALPDWAKDLSLNLSTLTRSTTLSEQQQWGALLAAAAATRNESVLAHVAEDAGEHVPASCGRHPPWAGVHADQWMVRRGDERRCPLEQDGGTAQAADLADRVRRVRLDALPVPLPGRLLGRPRVRQRRQEGGGLAGVRGQNMTRRAAQALVEELGQDTQRSGVDDGGGPGRNCAGGTVGCFLTGPGAVSDPPAPAVACGSQGRTQNLPQLVGPDGVSGVDSRPQDERLAAAGGGDDLGPSRQDKVLHPPGRGQAHHAGSGEHRTAGGQDGCTGIGLTAGPQTDHAAGVLVVIGARLGDHSRQVVAQRWDGSWARAARGGRPRRHRTGAGPGADTGIP